MLPLGSPQTPPCASPQSWLKKQRPAPLTSLSFPSKPPGAQHQLPAQWHPSHAAAMQPQAWDDRLECQVDSLSNHLDDQHRSRAVSSSVHTVDEDNVAIAGLHSFEFPYDHHIGLCSTSAGSQFQEHIKFAHYSNSFTTPNDPYQNPIYSAPLPLQAPFQRSLTFNHNIFNYEMTTTTTTAPNSPPDLSGSKSSKSSSFESSQYDGADGITNDVSNFEEIGLEDSAHTPCLKPAAWDENGPTNRSSSRGPLVDRWPVMPARDLTSTTNRPTYPSLQGQIQHALRSKSPKPGALPGNGGAAVRRGFTVPSTATLPMPLSGSQPRTRSSSPSPKQPGSASFATTGHNVRSGPPSKSAGPRSRRGSWQPSRKTIKQLEAEYHDSDDELPDDTSLWNVPMSPRPPTVRPSSTGSSKRGSPERGLHSEGPRPIPLSHAVLAAESAPPPPLSHSPPRNRLPPRTSSLQAAISTRSTPTSPIGPGFFRDSRAKSWTVAMAELSEEAQVLTETLEFHADCRGRIHEENLQNGVKSSRPSLESNAGRSTRSSAIELPPIQKGNILIDPMPLSKEKEAVLTRTRPSWLPPKDPKEEKKHLKEYQRMMAASLDAEKKKEARSKIRQCEKDDTREALNRIWEQYVYPDWDRVTQEHRTRELWWRGVSPKVRGQVWMRAVGNALGLTHMSYIRALQRGKDLQAKSVEELNEKERSTRAWFSDIERDASSTYPELNLFQKGSPMWHELVDVCCAYASYRSDVGYLYGIQLIAALMLLQLPNPADVFILLANCLNRPLALAFLTNDPGSTARALQQTNSAFLHKLPRLHNYLFRPTHEGGLNLHPNDIFEAIFRTLLSNGLDIDRVVRVWDCFVFEGDRIMIRAAVALLGRLQAQIFGIEGPVEEKRRMIRDLLAWGPTGRVNGYWDLRGDADSFMADVKEAGKLKPAEE